MSIWNKVFGRTVGDNKQTASTASANSGDAARQSDNQILKQIDSNNKAKMNDLNKLFARTEAMLAEIQENSAYKAVDQELIDSLMDVIYRSAIRTFITSVHNSFFKHKSMPMNYYDMIKPLIDRWRNTLDNGITLNKQSLIDFISELDEFSTTSPDFIFTANAGNDTLIPSEFFKQAIWDPYFKSGEEKAMALCNRMRRILEARGDNIELLVNSGYSLIDPFEFEELVATLFKKMGYQTEVTSKTGDFGIDIIARDEKDVIAIQTKKYAKGNNVGNRDVQRLLGAMQLRQVRANKAILITTSDFTFQAMEQAKEAPIELWDGSYITSLLRKYLNNWNE